MNGESESLTRILFVDDSKVMLKTASKILGTEFDVITAVDGDDAWAKLERDPEVQVLFTDINMPGTDGYALLERVRSCAERGLHAMPVIMVTGADDDEAARQLALERGATDFINKKSLSTELLPRARAHAKYQRITLQLQAQSTLDSLTGLPNEHGFADRLAQDIAYARRHGLELDLMRVEIEDLATIFQRRGEAMADHMVLQVANLIRGRIRKEDTAGRIGQGGFAVSFPGGHADGIEHLASWLHEQARAVVVDGYAFPIALRTAVVSSGPGAWNDTQDALNHGQAALDRAHRGPPAPMVPETAEPEPVAPQRAMAERTSASVAPASKETAASEASERVRRTTPERVEVAKPKPAGRDGVREQPRPERIPQRVVREPGMLQGLRSWLRVLGAGLRAGWERFRRWAGR